MINKQTKQEWKYYLSQYNELNIFDSRHPYWDYILLVLLIIWIISWKLLLLVVILRFIYLAYFY